MPRLHFLRFHIAFLSHSLRKTILKPHLFQKYSQHIKPSQMVKIQFVKSVNLFNFRY